MEKDDNITQQPVLNINGSIGQINIGSKVNNTYYYDSKGESNEKPTTKERNTNALDKAHLREEILEYVGRIFQYYTTDWQLRYKELWNDILDMPVVDLKVYNRGHQHDTHFNRNLVGNIIGYLNRYNLYADDIVPAVFARSLAKDGKGLSVRDALGGSLDTNISEAIKALMASKKYV